MRKIESSWPFVMTSEKDGLLTKLSFFLMLNVVVFTFHFLSGQPAATALLVGFLIGLVFYLLDGFLFRLICISATTLVFLPMDPALRSGMDYSPESSATRISAAQWSIYAATVLLMAALAFFFAIRYMQNLHRIKQYSRQLETALEKEVLSGQNKTKFIRNAYHEIRSQFWGIFIIIKILARSQRSGQVQDISITLNDLTNGCQNLQLLLNNILEYSKFESGISEFPHLEPIDPRLKITVLIRICQYSANEKNIQISFWAADDLPDYVACDVIKLTQVVMNLVGNAIRFSKPGTVISVMLRADSDRWYISVQDQGKGISSDRLAYIFDPFATSRYRDNDSDGIGLGLYITKQLVTALHGEIQVSSEENTGSCFTVCFPIQPFDTPDEIRTPSDTTGNYS